MHPRAHAGAVSRLLTLAAAAALATSGCIGSLGSPSPVPAAADVKTELRSVGPFTSITVDGPLNLVLGTGASAGVSVSAPSNVLALVQTAVSGTELVVTVAPPGFTSSRPVTVTVTSPTVTAVALDGGANGTMEAMAQAFSVTVSGGAVLKGIGTVQQLTVTVLGGSVAELGDLSAETAAISAAGGAKATLRVAKQLTGTADGGSVVTLVVAPVAQSVTVTGGAKVVGP